MNIGTVGRARQEAIPLEGEATPNSAVDRDASMILAAVRRDKVYPQIPSKCLYVDLEEETIGYALFAIRYDGPCCGVRVRTESNLLDRFAVLKPTGEVVFWDVADPESFKPYSSFLRRMAK